MFLTLFANDQKGFASKIRNLSDTFRRFMKSKKKIHQALEAYVRIKPLSLARADACVKQIIVGRYFICGTCISSSNENIPDISHFQLRSQLHNLMQNFPSNLNRIHSKI